MKMKIHTRQLAATVVFVVTLTGFASAQSILETIAKEIIAAKFGISKSEVSRILTASRLSLNDVAPILSASSNGQVRPDTVWKLRRKGLGWSQVAQRIGMHPGTFNKLRVAGAFDSGKIWSNALTNKFAVTGSDIAAVQKRGASPQDTIAAILIAKASYRTTPIVYEEFRKAGKWELIRRKNDVDFSNWKNYTKAQSPVEGQGKPMGRRNAPKNNSKGNGKSSNATG